MRKEIQDIQKRHALGGPWYHNLYSFERAHLDRGELLAEIERLEDVLARRTRIAGLARMLLLERHRVLLSAVATVARYAEFCGHESVPKAKSVARLLRDLVQNAKG